jgi:hypothetical protein
MQVRDLKVLNKNSLVASFTLEMQSGLTLHETLLFHSDGKWWVSPSSRPMVDVSGRQMVGADGKRQWSPLVTFRYRIIKDRWSAEVLAARRREHPELFAVEAAEATA